MKGMNKEEPVLVLFDTEEEYAMLMSDYLRGQRGLPWKIRSYTTEADLIENEKGQNISILVTSESSFSENLKYLGADKIIILNESGYMGEDEEQNISKYQPAENVLHLLIETYMEISKEERKAIPGKGRTEFIGVYSPIKRSLQTSFALTMSEIMGARADSKILYLSFEHYCGVADIMPGDKETDLSDLVYFLNSDSEKFKLHFQTIVKQRGSIYYVPPMKSGQNLLTVSGQEWVNLLRRISEADLFDYVIMDLTDSMQGLFEVLRSCKYVYTVMRDDKVAQVKMMNYENLLNMYEYKDVWDKSIRFVVPRFRYIPDTLEQYTHGDFADYVRKMISRMEVS